MNPASRGAKRAIPAAGSATGSSASVAERHLRKFAAKLVGFRRVGGVLKSIREFEEGSPSLFVYTNGVAQRICGSAVTAHMPGDRNRLDFRGEIGRNGNVDSPNVRERYGYSILEHTDFSRRLRNRSGTDVKETTAFDLTLTEALSSIQDTKGPNSICSSSPKKQTTV